MVCWNMLQVFDTDWVNIFLNRPTNPRIAHDFDAWTSQLPVEPPFPLSMCPKMFVGLGIYVVVSMLSAIHSIPGVKNNAKSTYHHYPSQRMAMVICPKNNSNIVLNDVYWHWWQVWCNLVMWTFQNVHTFDSSSWFREKSGPASPLYFMLNHRIFLLKTWPYIDLQGGSDN